MFLRGQAGGSEVLELSCVVNGGETTDPRAGQGAGCLQDSVQDGIEVKVFCDAQTGLGQP